MEWEGLPLEEAVGQLMGIGMVSSPVWDAIVWSTTRSCCIRGWSTASSQHRHCCRTASKISTGICRLTFVITSSHSVQKLLSGSPPIAVVMAKS